MKLPPWAAGRIKVFPDYVVVAPTAKLLQSAENAAKKKLGGEFCDRDGLACEFRQNELALEICKKNRSWCTQHIGEDAVPLIVVPPKFGKGQGKRPPHRLSVVVVDHTGKKVFERTYKSGAMSAAQKKLPFPERTLVTHTEAKAIKDLQGNRRVTPGSTVYMDGQYEACRPCKGRMNSFYREMNGRVRIVYNAPGLQTWNADGGRLWRGGGRGRG